MKKSRYVVIMAGGRGERFWPMSRLSRPKHLLSIVGDEPMISQTLGRLEGLVPRENIFIVTNREQHAAVCEVCSELDASQIIAEPVGRDTAPAVCLAKSLVKGRDPEGVFAILPADHVIKDEGGFKETLERAFEFAEEEAALVTLGIRPTYAATGYGYIEKGEKERGVYKVNQFVEKPDEARAREYVESGKFYWNAGMFVWRVSVLEEALMRHCSELAKAFNRYEEGGIELEAFYGELTKISIDYALMEKASNVYVVECRFDWDDVGEWTAIERHEGCDGLQNVIRGNVMTDQAKNNIIVNSEGHVTALIGVDDLIVVQTADATLICHKDKAQEIKKVVKEIGKNPELTHLV